MYYTSEEENYRKYGNKIFFYQNVYNNREIELLNFSFYIMVKNK